MRFLCIYKSDKPEGVPPTEHEMIEMGKFIDESMKSGVLLSAEGCLPSASGARVRLSKGKITITDGPFIETRELIGGFALIEIGSMPDAIEFTRRFLAIAGDGETEIRQLHETPAAAKA